MLWTSFPSIALCTHITVEKSYTRPHTKKEKKKNYASSKKLLTSMKEKGATWEE